MADLTLIADLARAGLEPELLQRVVIELAVSMAEREAAERRRARDRERKEFPRNSAEYSEIPGTVGTVGNVARAQPLTNTTLSTSLLPKEKKEREVSKEERKEGAI